MELGLTWPLQRLLKRSIPYGDGEIRGYCWDAHCITLHGRSSLLLVHCESRYTIVRFDLSPIEWANLDEIAVEEIGFSLPEAGVEEQAKEGYLSQLGAVKFTRTHGRREVAFLNRAWDDVLSADILVDKENSRQPLLNAAVNAKSCRCAGEDIICSAQEHLMRWFSQRKEP